MKKSIFAALAVIAIIWGTTAGASRQSPPQAQLTEDGPVGWSPGWYITPAHARMW